MDTRLPPGFQPQRFDKLLAEVADIVGPEWIFRNPDSTLQPYLDRMSARPPEYRMPSAAVCPATTEHTQRIVQLCYRERVPIWSYGNGRNWAYGGPSPLSAGNLVLDMKRMNRVLEVNEDLAYAIVEPGVSYTQLYQHLQEMGSKLWIDCAAPAWGGVIGNALEHGAGYTPYGDHILMACGMEVLLGDGSLVRTGMGAMPGNRAWALYKYGYGPHYDGMFSQGNLGVVTKMGVWLMPEPPGYKPFLITYPHEEQLAEIVERMRPLKINQVYPNAALIEHISYSAGVQIQRQEYADNDDVLPQSTWERMARDLDLGMWNVYGALYGLPDNIDYQWNIINEQLASMEGARVFFQGDRDDPGFTYRVKLMRGEPNMTEFNIVNWGRGGHLNFTPLAPIGGKHAELLLHTMRQIMNAHGFDYITEFVVGFRGMINLLMVMFDPRDEEHCRRADACSREIITTAARYGYGELKANLEYMDLVKGIYHANDNGLWHTIQKLKDALDPGGILSPGKSGIWPSDWPPPAPGQPVPPTA